MNKNIKHLFITLAICLVAVFAVPSTVNAATKPTYPKKQTLVHYAGKNAVGRNTTSISLKGVLPTTTVKYSELQSSNTDVIEIGDNYGYPTLITKKPGTSTISFTAKVKGKTYAFKSKVTVVKYTNPFKSFKIGSKDYASKFNKEPMPQWAGGGTKTVKGKLNIVLKKGWKITSLRTLYRSTDGFKYAKIKNKTYINLGPETKKSLYLDVKDTKTGIKYQIAILR